MDLTSPSPGPPPEVQVLEPEPPTTPVTPCPPSPELRLEDVECHRSQSAIFVRHYNRGGKSCLLSSLPSTDLTISATEGNSCSRTDLYFKPVPDSKLARKREERLRKLEEKERSASSAGSLPGMSPGLSRRPGPSPGHITPSTFGNLHDLDRMEREKRERELAEHRDRDIRMRDEMMRRGAMRPGGIPGLPHDPYLEASRRYAQAAQAAQAAGANLPSPYASKCLG